MNNHEEIFNPEVGFDPHVRYGKLSYEIWRDDVAKDDDSFEACIRWMMQYYRHKPRKFHEGGIGDDGKQKPGHWSWGFDNDVDKILEGKYEKGFQRTDNPHPYISGRNLEGDARTLGGHIPLKFTSCKEFIKTVNRVLGGELDKDSLHELQKSVNPLTGKMHIGKLYHNGYYKGTYAHLCYSIIAILSPWKYHIGHSYITPFSTNEVMKKWILFIKENFPFERFDDYMVGLKKPKLSYGMHTQYIRIERKYWDNNTKRLEKPTRKRNDTVFSDMFNVMLSIYMDLDTRRHADEELNALCRELLSETFLIFGYRDRYMDMEAFTIESRLVTMFANAMNPVEYARKLLSPPYQYRFDGEDVKEGKGEAQDKKYKRKVLNLIQNPTMQNLRELIFFQPFILYNTELERLMESIPDFQEFSRKDFDGMRKLAQQLNKICAKAAHIKIAKYNFSYSEYPMHYLKYLNKLQLAVRNTKNPPEFLAKVNDFIMIHSKKSELTHSEVIDRLILGEIDFELFKAATLWYSKIDYPKEDKPVSKKKISKAITL